MLRFSLASEVNGHGSRHSPLMLQHPDCGQKFPLLQTQPACPPRQAGWLSPVAEPHASLPPFGQQVTCTPGLPSQSPTQNGPAGNGVTHDSIAGLQHFWPCGHWRFPQLPFLHTPFWQLAGLQHFPPQQYWPWGQHRCLPVPQLTRCWPLGQQRPLGAQ